MANKKSKTLVEFFDLLPDNERLIVDVLRSIVLDTIGDYCKEKLGYNVPYFYKNKGLCIIWPATIPRGGIKTGVLFGFWQGNQLADVDNYLDQGTNKQIFYKIYNSVEEIDQEKLIRLLIEARDLDRTFKQRKS